MKVIAKDVNGKQHKVDSTDLEFRPSIYGIVIHEGKILLSPQFEGYDLPGGGIELGETHIQAVEREVKEETGIEATFQSFVGFETSFYKPHKPGSPPFHSLMIYCKCNYVGGELSVDGFDEDEKEYAKFPEWVNLKDLNNIRIASSVDWRKYVI
ncbi:TPA: NUDIX domain-containing protein [Candidatus Saccharibacteria bacterium]|nr:NUDIX domain-containing protein [Candidatus Saccharibacteria bacterium]HIO87968.1 NUDIX domain-containing protein [Candidatus Saccharibacteria bacterium]